MIKLTCLYNADGEVVGWFNDYGVEMAARREWNEHYRAKPGYGSQCEACRSKEVSIVAAELENVEPGDGDRVDYLYFGVVGASSGFCNIHAQLEADWLRRGAASVEIQRFLINKYRRPGKPNRDADLGGPTDAAGVLYVLKIKASR
jgi:hypothetical protein